MLVDITVHEYGVYSVLDSNRGRVFSYDSNGNLLYVFGYRGTDYGQVMQAVALDTLDDTMLILMRGKFDYFMSQRTTLC